MSTSTKEFPTFNAYVFFNTVIEKCIKKYDLEEYEATYLKSTYFYYLVTLRESNNLTDSDYIIMNYKILKQMNHECVQLFKRDYEYTNITHGYLLSKFKELLSMIKGTEDISFQLNNLNVDFNNTRELNKILNLSSITSKCIKYILKKFGANVLPLEIYLVLAYEIDLILLDNKEFFKNSNELAIQDYVFLVVTKQMRTIGKKIVVEENNLTSIIIQPPLKEDFMFNIDLQIFNSSYSLKLLTLYYGDNCWHKLINGYLEKDSKKYFCFNQEPHIKLESNNRQFKSIPLKTSNSNFLNENFQEIFFNMWDDRLTKKEKPFFSDYIKPALLNKEENINFKLSDFLDIDVKSILHGIKNTSRFEYNDDYSMGGVVIIPTITETDEVITLEINKCIY